jgi:hypothetical protein
LHLQIFPLHRPIFPLHLVESRILSPLAYINSATPLTHEVGKGEAAFIPKKAQNPTSTTQRIPYPEGGCRGRLGRRPLIGYLNQLVLLARGKPNIVPPGTRYTPRSRRSGGITALFAVGVSTERTMREHLHVHGRRPAQFSRSSRAADAGCTGFL